MRVMPAWEINFLGHTLSLSVLIPFALPLGIILGGAAIWPFFERWVTGDQASHQINDRPRDAPARTGIGVGVIVFYGVLWAEGANDVIADQFHVPLYTVTWIARVLVIVGPVAACVIARRICLGLQRQDARTLEHGVETGIILQSPDGEFTEVVRPVTDEERAVLAARSATSRALPAADVDGVPRPAGAGLIAKFRLGMNAVYTESTPVAVEANGHQAGNGHSADEGERRGRAGPDHAMPAAPDAPSQGAER